MRNQDKSFCQRARNSRVAPIDCNQHASTQPTFIFAFSPSVSAYDAARAHRVPLFSLLDLKHHGSQS